MKKLILLFLTLCFVACAQENKIYYDANWKETTQENALYYRLAPNQENDIWHIKDYYITGEKQFIGQAKDSLAKVLEGDATWYFKSGKVENKMRYIHGKGIGGFASFEGAIGSVEEGWNEEDLYYYDHTNVADARSASEDTYEYYYTGTYSIAIQHHSNVGQDGNLSFNLYFNKKGDTIGRLDKNKAFEKWEGTEVIFYETEQRGKNGMNSIKEIKTYSKGAHTNSEVFDANEKQIAEGSFKNNEPYSGTFFKEVCSFKKIQQYTNGVLLKEITFNKNNEQIGALSYNTKGKNTGTFYTCNTLITYKNGKFDGPTIHYLDDRVEVVDFEVGYKKGLRHGEYFIYDGTLLEKGGYKKGVLTGEVWYYHNGAYYEGDAEHFYYLKTTVKSVRNKPFISELSQFDLDTNELLQTFQFEKNNTDTFTYLDNGYHTIYVDDINSDGYADLRIKFNHHRHDSTTNTYYLFNAETNKYKHIPALDAVDDIVINASEKSIKGTISERFEDKFTQITYSFSKNELIKKLAIEHVYHSEKDTTIVTQLYPVPVQDFPLLDSSLPPITFIQNGNEQVVTGTDKTITLKKAPFSITLPGLLYKESSKEFMIKVMASYDMTIFNIAEINQKVEETPFYGLYATIAYDRNDPELYLSQEGYNVLFYDNSNDDTLNYIKNLNEEVLLLQFPIDSVFDEGTSVPISEVNKHIYMVIFIDKNENFKIEKGELYYINLILE